MRRKIVVTALCLALCLTACGGEAEKVTDYGGESKNTTAVASSETAGTEGAEDPGNSTEGSGNSSVPALPAPQMDGSPIYEKTFDLNGIPVEVGIKTVIRDADHFHSYQMKTVEYTAEKEKEIVQRLLGDSAKEVRRDLSLEEGDSELIMDLIKSIEISISGDANVWAKTKVPGWVDEDTFYHVYEGIYRDVDYELLVAKFSGGGIRVGLFPKIIGDPIGAKDCNRYMEVQTDLNGGGYTMINNTVVQKAMSDRPNRTQGSEEALIDTAESFVKDVLGMEIDRQDLVLTRGKGTGNPTKTELLFLSEEAENSKTLEGAVLDGYRIDYDMGHTGLEFSMLNQGVLCVTDQGVIGCTLDIFYEVDKVLSEDVQLLPFDKVMDSFQRGVKDKFEVSYVNGSKLKFHMAELIYYPISPVDTPEEISLVPVWRFQAMSNGPIGQVYINAIDGSWIEALYNAWDQSP